MNELSLRRVTAWIAFPSRRTWGECWWTARDICLTNQPELPDPLEAIRREHDRRIEQAFIFGTSER